MREGEGWHRRDRARRVGRGGTCRTRVPFPARSFSCNTARRVSRGAAPGPRPPPPPALDFLGSISGRRDPDARTRTLLRENRVRARLRPERYDPRSPDARDESARPTSVRAVRSRDGKGRGLTSRRRISSRTIFHIVITAAKGITPPSRVARTISTLRGARVGDAARASILRDTPRGGRQRAARGPVARVVLTATFEGAPRVPRRDAQPLDDDDATSVRSDDARRVDARVPRGGALEREIPSSRRLRPRRSSRSDSGPRVRGLVVAVSVVPVAAARGGRTSVEAGGVERHESKGRGGMGRGGRERGEGRTSTRVVRVRVISPPALPPYQPPTTTGRVCCPGFLLLRFGRRGGVAFGGGVVSAGTFGGASPVATTRASRASNGVGAFGGGTRAASKTVRGVVGVLGGLPPSSKRTPWRTREPPRESRRGVPVRTLSGNTHLGRRTRCGRGVARAEDGGDSTAEGGAPRCFLPRFSVSAVPIKPIGRPVTRGRTVRENLGSTV